MKLFNLLSTGLLVTGSLMGGVAQAGQNNATCRFVSPTQDDAFQNCRVMDTVKGVHMVWSDGVKTDLKARGEGFELDGGMFIREGNTFRHVDNGNVISFAYNQSSPTVAPKVQSTRVGGYMGINNVNEIHEFANTNMRGAQHKYNNKQVNVLGSVSYVSDKYVSIEGKNSFGGVLRCYYKNGYPETLLTAQDGDFISVSGTLKVSKGWFGTDVEIPNCVVN